MSRTARIACSVIALVLCVNELLFPVQAMAITDIQRFMRQDAWAVDDECVASGAASVTLAGNNNLEKILNFYLRKGLNLAQAAGIVGNMMQESGLKPNIVQGGKLVADNEEYQMQNGVGFGLVQWTFTGRQKPLQDHVDKMGVKNTDLSGQLSFTWEELSGPYLSTLNNLRRTNDPVEAAVAVHDGYESSADSDATVRSVRGGNAKKVYDQYKNAPALAGSTASADMNNPSGEANVDSHGQDTPGDTSSTADISKVYILGDSITLGATQKYESKLKAAGAKDVKVSASGGGNLQSPGTTGTRQSGLSAIDSDSSYIKDATAIVIAHGTNQLSNANPSSADYIANQEQVIKDAVQKIKGINSKASLYWVDVAISDAAPSNVTAYAGKVNQAIYGAQSAGYSVISWSKAVDPGYTPATATGPVSDSKHLLTDGVHPNSNGQDTLVDTVIDALKKGSNSGDKDSGNSCTTGSFSGGNLDQTLKAYAWPEYKGMTIEATKDYQAAVKKALAGGYYTGGTTAATKGIDCGGFVTLLVRDSGYDPGYNFDGKGGATPTQEQWMQQHWQKIPPSDVTPGKLQPGDVAINSSHTFIYVAQGSKNPDGFNAPIASASLDERAPMADNQQSPTQPGYNWYRKK